MNTFIIDIDPDEYDDAITALVAFANDANVTFTNVRPANVTDRAFGEYVAFDATHDDVARYIAFYALDDDDIELA